MTLAVGTSLELIKVPIKEEVSVKKYAEMKMYQEGPYTYYGIPEGSILGLDQDGNPCGYYETKETKTKYVKLGDYLADEFAAIFNTKTK